MQKRSFIRSLIIIVIAAITGLLVRQNRTADCSESPAACEHCGQANSCSQAKTH